MASKSLAGRLNDIIGGVESKAEDVASAVKKAPGRIRANVDQGQRDLADRKAAYYGSINPLKGVFQK